MAKIPVFGGLGSDIIFSDTTRDWATQDSRSLEAQLLAETCHKVFLEEIRLASSQADGVTGIDLNDFGRPHDIIQPCQRYHHHPIVQHATLSLLQLLRYQSHGSSSPRFSTRGTVAVSGFCAGLFTAAAVATAQGPLQYLARAEECFRAAVMLGIVCEQARRKIKPLQTRHPWSLVVANIEEEDMSQLISKYSASKSQSTPIYVSSLNTKTVVTISGEGDSLDRFARSELPAKCRMIPTNIFTLYHNSCLHEYKYQLLEEFEKRKLAFPSRRDLVVPIISTIDGSLIQSTEDGSSTDLLNQLLDMILMECTNWVSVEDAIVSLAHEEHRQDRGVLTVWNYGPCNGALTRPREVPEHVEVLDAALEVCTENPSQETDIAVVGMGLDLPGAPDPEALWRNLMNTVNSCSEIPSDRFHLEDYYCGNGHKPVIEGRSLWTRFGNFMDDPFLFDNQAFGISPREASSMDPQQRVMLTTVQRALENAGYVPDSTPSFVRETFGCFIGNATLDYVDNLRNDIDVYYSPGTLRAFLSGRISYAFRWSGPSITVDTACSSSLVAIYQAARALAAGECRAAVAGGVNVITSPDMYLGLDRAHFLSPTGQCKAFDKAADGYCRSEGCAAVVLKRLDDAVNENDNILGVIKGIAVNQSGLASSITHPHAPTQEKLFKEVLSKTGVRPEDVSVVEAHGTGTPAGDPNEVRGIRNVFCKGRSRDDQLHIMSIKANIGHCEAASGVASLTKLLLMLKHKRIPPQALLKELNPAIENLSADGTVISTEPKDWAAPRGNRRTALLNNFGAAGSNAALLLQEYQCDTRQQRPRLLDATTHVFGCSARNADLLQQLRESLVSYLTKHQSELSIADVCYTSTARRSLQSYRLSTTASSIEGLIANLKDAQILEAPDRPRSTVFLFSGQGSQYMGMGSKLMDLCPKFRSTVHRCHRLLLEWGLPSCLDVIQPDEERPHQAKDPMVLQALQTGVFVLEVAVAQVLMDVGIRPLIVSGHSLGEYAALVTAGALDLESGLWLVAQRARLIISSCKLWETSMLAVDMSSSQVQQDLLSWSELAGLSIACENSPGDCVVGGDKQKLLLLKEHISQHGRRSTMLNVPLAYHTAALDQVAEDIRQMASQVCIAAPTIPITSNVLGRVVQPGEHVFTPEYFSQHCCRTVAFDSGLDDILRQHDSLLHGRWIEIGPHPVLLPMVAYRLSSGTPEKLATLRKGKDPSQTLSDIFCAVYRDDVDIQWRAVFENMYLKPKMIDLPASPMNPKRYHSPVPRELVSGLPNVSTNRPAGTRYALLDNYVGPSGDITAEFHTPIQSLEDLIRGHVVCGKPLCPASIYAEMALAAISHAEGADAEDQVFKLSGMSFTRPLLFSKDSAKTISITIHREERTDIGQIFRISSFSDRSKLSEPKLHSFGKIKRQSLLKAAGKLKRTERALARRKASFERGGHQMFSTATMYKKIFSRVVEYSPQYWAVRKLYVDDDAEEAFASCELPATSTHANYAGHPILLDTMLHVAGFTANLNVDADTVCICHHVASVSMLRKTFRSRHAFDVHCSNSLVPAAAESIFADVHAVDGDGIIAVMKGVEFKRSKLSKIQAGFEMIAGDFPKTSDKADQHVRLRQQREVEEPRPVATKLAINVDDYEGSTATESLVTSPASVVDILSKTTGVKAEALTPRTRLAALGVDSLMILELEKKLEDFLGHSPGVSELSMCESVGDVEALVGVASSSSSGGSRSPGAERRSFNATERTTSSSTSQTSTENEDTHDREEPQVSDDMVKLLRSCLRPEEQPMARVQNGSKFPDSAPMYLIHPGAGMCLEYHRIAPLDRDVHAIQDPRMFSDAKEDWSSIEEMAQHYAALVSRSRPSHPGRGIILGGYSFGGTVAFETARLLSERGGCLVRGVVLIDPPPPLDHVPIARDTVQAAMAAKHGHQSAGARSPEAARFHEAIGALAVRNNLRRAALLGRYRPRLRGVMPRVVLLRSSEGFSAAGCVLPENKWLHDRRDVRTSSAAWEELVGAKVKVIDVPGDHFTPFEPGHIDGTSQAIYDACQMLDD